MEEKQLALEHYHALKEIAAWRAWYLKNKLTNTNYAFLPDRYKDRLISFFTALHSAQFDTPDTAWDASLNSLLSYLAEETGN